MPRKPETIAFWRDRLPHWEVIGGQYFVTVHLQGAIPESGQQRIHALAAEFEKVPRSWADQRRQLQRRVFAEMEKWLDRTSATNHLRHPAVANILMEAIRYREQRDWQMFEFVLMPSHIHLFFEIAPEAGDATRPRLKKVLEQFKRWTGHEAAKALSLADGRFWQDEWFDHWSRSNEEDERICAYIRRNPEKAGLVARYQDWPYGSWHK